MDSYVAEKFCEKLGLTQEQIQEYEADFSNIVLPVSSVQDYISKLVLTIEYMINKKRKEEAIRNIQQKQVLLSIILTPLNNGTVKAMCKFNKGDAKVLITYWENLDEDQLLTFIAHELGHVVNRYFFNNRYSASEEASASLFAYIVLENRDKYHSSLELYDRIVNLCNRKGM